METIGSRNHQHRNPSEKQRQNPATPPTATNGQTAGVGQLLASAGPRVTRRCPQASSEPAQPPCGRAEPAPGRTHRQHRRTCRSRRRSSTVHCKRDERVRHGDHEEVKVAFSIRLRGRVSLVSSGKAAGECHRTFWEVVAGGSPAGWRPRSAKTCTCAWQG
jgi:hypothetical protein